MDCVRFAVSAAVALFNRGRYAQAAAAAERLLERLPEAGPVWQLCGTAHWRNGEFDAALAALETATTLEPLDSTARLALADCYVRAGLTETATAIYLFLAEDGHCPASMLPSVAAGLGRLNENAAALDVCEKLALVAPDHHAARFGIVFYRQRLGRPPQEWIEPLEAAGRLAPRITMYRVNLAFALAALGRLQDAADRLAEVEVAAVGCPGAVERMRRIFAAVGDHAGCRRCCQRLTALHRRHE